MVTTAVKLIAPVVETHHVKITAVSTIKGVGMLNVVTAIMTAVRPESAAITVVT